MSNDIELDKETADDLKAEMAYAVTPSNLLLTLEHLMSGKGKEQAAVMVWGAMGIGKALPLTAKVLTPSGWTTMGEVNVGDIITAYDGANTKVLGVFPQGELDIYEITFSDGRTAQCCGQHLWKIYTYGGKNKRNGGWSVMKTEDIKFRMENHVPMASEHYIPLVSKFINKQEQNIPLDPYVLGCLIGDGTLSRNSTKFTNEDTAVVDRISERLPTGVVLNRYKEDGIEYGVSAPGTKNILQEALNTLNLSGHGAADKFIPDVYKNANHEVKIELMKGLMDTDGYVSKSGSLSYTTISQQLASDVQELVRSLGGIAKITEKIPTYTYKGEKLNGKLAYTVSIRYSSGKDFVSMMKKMKRISEDYQYSDLKLKITGIEKKGRAQAQCILIDHHEHLFVTDDYVVTHNTEIVRTLGELWGCRIVALHLPQFDPTDLKGIPVRMEDGRVVWVPSSYLPKQQNVTISADQAKAYKSSIDLDMPNAIDIAVHVNDRTGKTIATFNDKINTVDPELPLAVKVDMLSRKVSITVKSNDKHPDVSGYTIGLIDKSILFLDELSAAVPEVQNAALQLCLDRRVGEYDVPDGVPIVGAGNRESDMAFVNPMSAPLSNRFCHIRLVPNLTDWVEWAILKRVHPHILAYLQWKGSKALMNFEPDKMAEGDGGFPTPRSWYKLSKQMANISHLPEIVFNAIVTGYIGRGMGHDFIAYRKVCENLPSTQDILDGRKVEINDDLDLGARYGLAMSLCYRLQDYHDEFYDPSIKNINDQNPRWKTATVSFSDFIDKYLGKEMTVLCIHIVSSHLGISLISFKGTKKFQMFATRYRDILRKTV